MILAAYGIWIGAYLAFQGDVRDFIRIGTIFIWRGRHQSTEIRVDPGYRVPKNQDRDHPGLGYDGQFAYYLALDPSKARYYMDLPSYRYTHVLQPMVARGLALGHRDAIPWTLLIVNWLAVGAGTWALAAWLRRRGVSPWWAGIYGLWPGMLIAVQRDLTEPLAYALVAGGLLLLDGRSRWSLPAAGIVFGLAGLARSTTLVFPIVLALWIAFRGWPEGGEDSSSRRPAPGRGGLLLALSVVPFVAYSLYLLDWLGSVGTGGASAVPFAGLVTEHFRLTRQGIDLLCVVVPAIAAVIALLPRRPFGTAAWLPWLLLLANFLVNIGLYKEFQRSTYTSVSRYAIGIVVAGLMCIPHLGELDPRRRRWLAGALILSMALLPVVAVYGFTNIPAPG